MKAGFVCAVSTIFFVSTTAEADDCYTVCGDLKKVVSFKSGCSPFRNSLPRPKVARYCQQGFKAAMEMNCYDACINGGRLQSFLTERRLDEVCHHALKETPRPLCHDACVRGYHAGVQDMSTALVKRMAESPPKPRAISTEDVPGQIAAISAQILAAADFMPDEETAKTAGESTREEIVRDEAPEGMDDRASMLHEGEGVYPGGVHPGGIHPVDVKPEEPPLSAGEVGRLEDENLTANNDSPSLGAQEKEGIDTRNQEDDVVLSLPIIVDNVEKELVIFEKDDPMEVVLAFCAEYMPDEGAACADQLLRVVGDKMADYDTPGGGEE